LIFQRRKNAGRAGAGAGLLGELISTILEVLGFSQAAKAHEAIEAHGTVAKTLLLTG
jgi:hypothetical protein